MKSSADSGYSALKSPASTRASFTRPWLAGKTKQLPLVPLLAALIVLLSTAATVMVLVASEGKPVDEWPGRNHSVQPSVLIAIFVAIANTVLPFLLFQGVQRAWWCKALEGATIGDLHRYWSYGTSVISSASSGKNFNFVALANLFTALVVIDGPLLQRSSTITTLSHTQDVTISSRISNNTLPSDFMGLSSANGGGYIISAPFLKVVQQYYNHDQIQMQSDGCNGSCATTLQAVGFDFECHSTTSLNLTLEQGQQAQGMWSNMSFTPTSNGGSLRFATNFFDGLVSTTNFNMEYSSNSAFCSTSYTSVVCNILPAQVRYPVTISEGVATLSKWSLGFNETEQLSYGDADTTSTLEAMATAAGNLFNASASLTLGLDGSNLNGILATLYMKQANSNSTSCNAAWSDPTADVINALRELMFRAAIAASNASTQQTTVAEQTSIRAVYASHYSWLGGAIIVILLTVLAITPLFSGWWHLGRSVSLSPIETAKAFEAPLLYGDAYNADVNLLLKEMGKRRVRYGEAAFVESSGRRLRIGEPSQTVQPTPGQFYGANTSQWRDG